MEHSPGQPGHLSACQDDPSQGLRQTNQHPPTLVVVLQRKANTEELLSSVQTFI